MVGKKKYRVIVKVGNDDFKRWSCNSLLSLQRFLDKEHPEWRWCNYYRYTKAGDGEKLGSFTKKSRLLKEPYFN